MIAVHPCSKWEVPLHVASFYDRIIQIIGVTFLILKFKSFLSLDNNSFYINLKFFQLSIYALL